MKYFSGIAISIIPTLLGAITVVFLVIHLIPGDPVQVMLGDFASPEAEEKLRESLGLNEPLWRQYVHYVVNVSQGDLGSSIRLGGSVLGHILGRLTYTVSLALAAGMVSVLVGVPLGVVAAVKRNKPADYITRTVALVGVSMPTFWLSLLLILIFAVKLSFFPVLGSSANSLPEFLHRLVLPAVALGIVMAALITRITRASMLDVLAQDYVRTARAKGLSDRLVLYRHALRNALMPIITIVGLNIGQLLGGAVVTETVFNWPGLGKLFIDSMFARDYPMIQGVALFFAFAVIVVNLLTDLIYGVVNPVVRNG